MTGRMLVLDVGSSALKAVLFDKTGAIAAAASRPLPTSAAQRHAVEQDVDLWWEAARDSIAELTDRAAVAAVALTGSMQNLIALTGEGRPLGPAILYSDRRLDAGEVEELGFRLPGDYAERTGNHLDPAHCILKIMRIERFLPHARDTPYARLLFGAKDAVIFRMTGAAVIDRTTASTTGLFDLRAGRWDAELVAASGAAAKTLPAVMPADAVAGRLLPEAAEELGLPGGIPVFNGAGDGAAATWGAFADRPGSAYAYIGTTGWVAATQLMEEADPPRDIYTLADPIHAGRVILISPFLTAGSAVEWLSELTGQPVETLLDKAEHEDAAPSGALFLPYLSGERGPFEDQAVRGAFVGLDRGQRPGALCHAVLEGIAFAIRHNLEAAGLPDGPLTLIGGGGRSPVQRRLLADVTGREVCCPDESREMPALGIYRMIAPKIGFAPADKDAGNNRVAPRPARRGRHDERFKTYLDLSDFARSYAGLLV